METREARSRTSFSPGIVAHHCCESNTYICILRSIVCSWIQRKLMRCVANARKVIIPIVPVYQKFCNCMHLPLNWMEMNWLILSCTVDLNRNAQTMGTMAVNGVGSSIFIVSPVIIITCYFQVGFDCHTRLNYNKLNDFVLKNEAELINPFDAWCARVHESALFFLLHRYYVMCVL